MHRYILFFFSVCLNLSLFAQETEGYDRILRSASSVRGNFIYMWDGGFDYSDSNLYTSTKHFELKRIQITKEIMAKYDGYKQVLKKAENIGIAGPKKSEKEILALYPNVSKNDILQYLGLASDVKLTEIYNNNTPPSAFQGLFQLMETKLALGNVFLDATVEVGKIYVYIVTRITVDGKSEPWGSASVLTGSGNYWLPYLKPAVGEVEMYDSLVSCSWKVFIGDDFPQKVPIPIGGQDLFDSVDGFYALPYSPKNLRALVYTMDETGKFTYKEKIGGVLNESQDTLTFHYYESCKPEQELYGYLVLEDDAYNIGIESDTVHLAAITKANLPLILTAQSEAIPDAIRVSWSSPPPKIYIAGVQVIRSFGNTPIIDTFPLFPITDTSFVDYNIEPGKTYSYEIKTVFKSYVKHTQEIAATTQNVCKVFSYPLPPYSLVANPLGDDIKLNWQSAQQKNIYGYYIYRGVDRNQRFLVAGPVMDTTFIDTSTYLSGKTVYFYSVLAMNLRQDTSVHSNIASAKPNKAIPMEPVSSLQFYQANEELYISWHDARIENNFIDGYLLERRFLNNEFTPICDSTILMPMATDTISFGNKYQYRVAPVDMFGNLGPFSKIVPYSMPEMNPVDFIDDVKVRNIQEGIKISIPAIVYSNYKEYTLFRRLASEDDFTQLAVFPATQFSYVDTSVEEGTIYVYAIAITQTDGRQGPKGSSISRRRVKPVLDK